MQVSRACYIRSIIGLMPIEAVCFPVQLHLDLCILGAAPKESGTARPVLSVCGMCL